MKQLLNEHPEGIVVKDRKLSFNRALGCFVLMTLHGHKTFAYSYNGLKKVYFGDGSSTESYSPHEDFAFGETHRNLFNAIHAQYPDASSGMSDVVSGRIWKIDNLYYIATWQIADDVKHQYKALVRCLFHMTKSNNIANFNIEIDEARFIPLNLFLHTDVPEDRPELEKMKLLHMLPPEEKNRELKKQGAYMKIDAMPDWMKKRFQGLDEMEYPMATGSDMRSYEGMAGWKGKIVWMEPDRFLQLCHPLKNVDKSSMDNLEQRMLKQLPIDFLVLIIDVDKKKITGHEGRHRATLAKKLGIEKIPVLIYTGNNFKRVPTWDDNDHKYIDGIANVGHDIKPEYVKEFYRLFTEASMIPTMDERESAIRRWLDMKIANAPGKSHLEKSNWLWNNDPQYSKVVTIFLKFHKSSSSRKVESHEKYYIRFGDLPKAGKSMNYLRMVHEKGISAYPAKWNTQHNKWEILDNQLSEGGLSGLYELTYDSIYGVGRQKRPIYLITGYELDELGGDDEPLLDVNRIKILKKLQPHEFFSAELGLDWYI
jgi:hypothetical protein